MDREEASVEVGRGVNVTGCGVAVSGTGVGVSKVGASVLDSIVAEAVTAAVGTSESLVTSSTKGVEVSVGRDVDVTVGVSGADVGDAVRVGTRGSGV